MIRRDGTSSQTAPLPADASSTPAVHAGPRQADADASLVVYYDGSCPLCTVEINHYAAQRGGERLAFVDVSGPDPATGNDLAPGAALQRFHVRLPDGRLVSGARAFVAIWTVLPAWRRVAQVARVPGVTPALELFYRLFLPLRPFLSRLAGRLGARAARDGGRGTR